MIELDERGEPTREALEKLVEEAVDRLAEHFDSVRIIATKDDGPGGTSRHITRGAGSYYAQIGSVRNWLISEDAYTAERAAQRVREED